MSVAVERRTVRLWPLNASPVSSGPPATPPGSGGPARPARPRTRQPEPWPPSHPVTDMGEQESFPVRRSPTARASRRGIAGRPGSSRPPPDGSAHLRSHHEPAEVPPHPPVGQAREVPDSGHDSCGRDGPHLGEDTLHDAQRHRPDGRPSAPSVFGQALAFRPFVPCRSPASAAPRSSTSSTSPSPRLGEAPGPGRAALRRLDGRRELSPTPTSSSRSN